MNRPDLENVFDLWRSVALDLTMLYHLAVSEHCCDISAVR